jgi:DNA-binding LacI/PurR family transcriptional regulator
VPVVTVSGHTEVKGVVNIVLNHQRAAEVALKHLFQLGHRQIAFIKGQEFSSDTEDRWSNIERAAQNLGLKIKPTLIAQLKGDSPSPQPGYLATKSLLAASEPFTALFTFNDISAIGAMRALTEAGLRVPENVSVVGFDDIQSAGYQNPGLTTVRQPLREMGRTAAEILVKRINRPGSEIHHQHVVEPELVVRETTCSVSGKDRRKSG